MYKLTTPLIAIEVDKDLTDADDVELTISDTVNHFFVFSQTRFGNYAINR